MLILNHLTGFGVGGGPSAASIVFIARTTDTVNATTFTFTGASLGSAAERTGILVGVHGQAGALRTWDSMTVAGNAATRLESVNSAVGNPDAGAIFFIANSSLPLGTETSGNIVVTGSGAFDHCTISVFTLHNTATSAYSTVKNQASGLVASNSIDCPAGGVIMSIGHTSAAAADPTSMAITNGTERYDVVPESGGRLVVAGASDAYATVQTGLTITYTGTSGGSSQSTSMIATSFAAAA